MMMIIIIIIIIIITAIIITAIIIITIIIASKGLSPKRNRMICDPPLATVAGTGRCRPYPLWFCHVLSFQLVHPGRSPKAFAPKDPLSDRAVRNNPMAQHGSEQPSCLTKDLTLQNQLKQFYIHQGRDQVPANAWKTVLTIVVHLHAKPVTVPTVATDPRAVLVENND